MHVHCAFYYPKGGLNTYNEVNNMTSFVFVRHPYTRLVSAYEDKILANETKRKFRSYQKKGRGSFPHFIDVIIAKHELNDNLDVHFRPFHQICDFCHVDFDIIGKLETFDEDIEAVSGLKLKLSKRHVNKKRQQGYKKYFKELNSQQLKRLEEIYFLDFKLFDYDSNKF